MKGVDSSKNTNTLVPHGVTSQKTEVFILDYLNTSVAKQAIQKAPH